MVNKLNIEVQKLNSEKFVLMEEIYKVNQEKEFLTNKYSTEIAETSSKYKELERMYEDLFSVKKKAQENYEERIKNLGQTLVDREKILALKYETEKNVAIQHIIQEKNEKESVLQKNFFEISKKYEELLGKYNRVKQQKKILRISDNNSQKYTQEMHEKDRLISELRKEKNSLKSSLEYLNSTVRIFSSQEKTFHTKNTSFDAKFVKKSTKTQKFSNTIRF